MRRLLLAALLAASVSGCAAIAPSGRPSGSAESTTVRLAEATAKIGDHQEAARLFEKALAAEPDSVPALLGLGTSYAALGQQGRAESALLRAHELEAGNVEVLTALARVQLNKGDPAKAVEYYDLALRRRPTDLSALTGKGVALDAQSRHLEAQRVYETGMKSYPTNYVLRSNYALSIVLVGEVDRGLSILRELVRDPVAAPHVRGNLALAYGLAGRETDARATLALDLSAAEIEENITVYAALRRMIAEGKPVGALVFS